MINPARQNHDQQPDDLSSADDYIAPVPRISVQAFCVTDETAAVVLAAGSDAECHHPGDQRPRRRPGRPR
jgi:pilus assembly protein CpaE